MSSILNTIRRSYRWANDRDWDRLYWAIDLHGTVLKADYQTRDIATSYYPFAEEALHMLSDRLDTKLIMYTSSTPEMVGRYDRFFLKQKIYFDFLNSNPEVKSSGHGYFEDKFYFNVLLDDKAGFEPEHDWQKIIELLKATEELHVK